MNFEEIRSELSIRGKNGLGFLLAGVVVWIIISVIFFTNLEIYYKTIGMLFATGIMFPLSIAFNGLLKADWKLEGNPLSSLGLILNFAQFIYFPILIWAIGTNTELAVFIFAIITGAHFFPYGWFYQSKAYYIMSPVLSIAVMVIGWNLAVEKLWIIPLTTVILLSILVIWLYQEYRAKLNRLSRS